MDRNEFFVTRYCPDGVNTAGLSEKAMANQQREILEAQWQIALLFALLDRNKPTEDELMKLLVAINDGSISSARIQGPPGYGYAPGYGPLGYETASGRAILATNSRLLRVVVVNREAGYSKPPIVTISPQAAIRFAQPLDPEDADWAIVPELATASTQAKASLFKSGVNKGRIERI